MTQWIANARMYAVTPEAEAAWQALLAHIAKDAGVPLAYMPYPAPQPLEDLWRRPDLGCALMCGYPIALRLANVVAIAAPIPSAPWAQGAPRYRSDFITRADARFATLPEAFVGSFGWTVRHSHSGFNAPRHHLLAFRQPGQTRLFAQARGDLVTARRVLDMVSAGAIDCGPLDSYWHHLIALHQPALARDIRVLESTALSPMPAFVVAASMPAAEVARLRDAFVGASGGPWFAALAGPLALSGFALAGEADFALTLQWETAARAAGYGAPQ